MTAARSASTLAPWLLALTGLAPGCADDGPPLPRPQGSVGVDADLAAEIETLVAEAERTPGDPEPRLRLGLLYEANGLFSLATRAYETVAAVEPATAKPWFRLAIARERDGDLEGAIAAMRRAAAADDAPPAATARLASWLLDAGDVDAAAAAAQRAAQHPDAVEEAFFAAVRVHLARDDPASALALAEASGILSGPNGAHARLLVASALRAQGRLDEIDRLRLEPTARPPSFPDPWRQELGALRIDRSSLAEAGRLLQRGECDRALEILETMADTGDDQRRHNMMAQCHLQLGRAAEAIAALRRAIEIDPRHFGSHLNLAKAIWLQVGDGDGPPADGALAAIDRALELDPRSAEAWRLRGAILIALGSVDDGVEAYLDAWRLDARDPAPMLRAGNALFDRRQIEPARTLFDAVAATDATDTGALFGLFRCAMAAEDLAAAAELLDRIEAAGGASPRLAAARRRLAAKAAPLHR